jgi:hypothetical protein
MALLVAREASEYLHVSLFTLSRIEKEALLVPFRTPGGDRRYSLEMLNEYLEHTRFPSAGARGRILVVDDGNELGGQSLLRWNRGLTSLGFSPRSRSAT